MTKNPFDYVITIGGEAGQGMQTLGILLSKAFLKVGYYISTYQSYHSRVRGGHNYFQIRFSSAPVHSMRRGSDILVALDQNTLSVHTEISETSIIIYDAEKIQPTAIASKKLGLEIDKLFPAIRENELYANSLYLGTIARLIGCPPEPMRELLLKMLGKKGNEVVEKNLSAFNAGLAVSDQHTDMYPAGVSGQEGQYMTLSGNQAIALGAIAAGCKFYTAYPMTPASSILDTMAGFAEQVGMVVEQAEDEIAALNMVQGAVYMGIRAMTGTSGGGFALMAEALSLCGMIESPAVIALAQRPGPATGLPTRTEQADLSFVVHAGHGEFPRAVLAPSNHTECFEFTAHAFNLADRFQIPVFIMTDQYLADLYSNVVPFDYQRVVIDRGKLVSPDEQYQRYALSEDGISPRAFPGKGPGIVVVDSDEHTEDGHLTENLHVRVLMHEKRLQKSHGLLKEFIEPEIIGEHKENLLICWGSSGGPCLDAVFALQKKGIKISLLRFKQVWPLPAEKLKEWLSGYSNKIMVEGNFQSQLAKLIRAETSIEMDHQIKRYDGMPFFSDELMHEIEKCLKL